MIDDFGGLLSEVCKICGDNIYCDTDPRVPEEDLVKEQNIFVYFPLVYRLINFSVSSYISLMFIIHLESAKIHCN